MRSFTCLRTQWRFCSITCYFLPKSRDYRENADMPVRLHAILLRLVTVLCLLAVTSAIGASFAINNLGSDGDENKVWAEIDHSDVTAGGPIAVESDMLASIFSLVSPSALLRSSEAAQPGTPVAPEAPGTKPSG